jgi:hypothetical protein
LTTTSPKDSAFEAALPEPLVWDDADAMYTRPTAFTRDQIRDMFDAGWAARGEADTQICAGIGATYTGEARRLQGQHATHAAGQRDGANECAAAIKGMK